jgi:hypothetical protein
MSGGPARTEEQRKARIKTVFECCPDIGSSKEEKKNSRQNRIDWAYLCYSHADNKDDQGNLTYLKTHICEKAGIDLKTMNKYVNMYTKHSDLSIPNAAKLTAPFACVYVTTLLYSIERLTMRVTNQRQASQGRNGK